MGCWIVPGNELRDWIVMIHFIVDAEVFIWHLDCYSHHCDFATMTLQKPKYIRIYRS